MVTLVFHPRLVSFIGLKSFVNFGWKVMLVITIITFLGICYRLFPRRTR
jgi:hypothetical protein